VFNRRDPHVPQDVLTSADSRQFLENSIRKDNRQRVRVQGSVAAALKIIGGLAIWAGMSAHTATVEKGHADERLRDEAITHLVSDGTERLNQHSVDGDVRALQQFVVADELSRHDQQDALLDPVMARRDTVRIFPTGKPLTSVALSTDGDKIAAGGTDGTIWLWDARSGKPLFPNIQAGDPTLAGGSDNAVRSLAFSKAGDLVISGTAKGAVQMWDTATGQEVGRAPDPKAPIVSLAIGPDGRFVAYGQDDGGILTWDATGPLAEQPLRAMKSNHGAITGLAVSEDGLLILAGSRDGTVTVWNTRTRTQDGPDMRVGDSATPAPVWAVAASPDSSHIVAAGWGGDAANTIVFWRVSDSTPTSSQAAQSPGIHSVAYSPDGKRVVSGGIDNSVQLWDAKTGRPVGAPLVGHGDDCRGCNVQS
jgi:WD40 repeat protein